MQLFLPALLYNVRVKWDKFVERGTFITETNRVLREVGTRHHHNLVPRAYWLLGEAIVEVTETNWGTANSVKRPNKDDSVYVVD